MRTTKLERNTKETKIKLAINLDGTGVCKVKSGCGFLDHMLELFAHHSKFDIEIFCDGDTYVDYHHSVEDIAILLGSAIRTCLGDCKGINRYGSCTLPMDEVLMLTAIDICSRSTLVYNVEFKTEKVGDFDVELAQEFMLSLARNLNASIHFHMQAGGNTHHVIEAMFKSLARCLRHAVAIDKEYANEIPSSKGMI